MKIYLLITLCLLISIGQCSSAQTPKTGKLTIKITNIRNTEGNIRVALRTDENTIVASKIVEIDPKTLTAEAVFDNLPRRHVRRRGHSRREQERKAGFQRHGCADGGLWTFEQSRKTPRPTQLRRNKIRLRRAWLQPRDCAHLLVEISRPQTMNVRLLIPTLFLATAWFCASAQDPPSAEENSVSTRYSLAVIDDATFYSGQPASQPAILNQVLVEPTFDIRYQSRLTFSTSLIGLSTTYTDTTSTVHVKETYAGLSAGDFDFTAGPQDGSLGHWIRLHRRRRPRSPARSHQPHRPSQCESGPRHD